MWCPWILTWFINRMNFIWSLDPMQWICIWQNMISMDFNLVHVSNELYTIISCIVPWSPMLHAASFGKMATRDFTIVCMYIVCTLTIEKSLVVILPHVAWGSAVLCMKRSYIVDSDFEKFFINTFSYVLLIWWMWSIQLSPKWTYDIYLESSHWVGPKSWSTAFE